MMMYRGFKITATVKRTADRGVRQLITKIDGHVLDVRTAIRPDPDAAVASARFYIDDSINRPDAYEWTRHLTAGQLARKTSA